MFGDFCWFDRAWQALIIAMECVKSLLLISMKQDAITAWSMAFADDWMRLIDLTI